MNLNRSKWEGNLARLRRRWKAAALSVYNSDDADMTTFSSSGDDEV